MVIQSNATMKIVFRVDASIQMGTGHVMRCLTLADALKNQGADCYFICREHPGNLMNLIVQRGYHVDSLPYIENYHLPKQNKKVDDLAHSSWLGATQKEDAELCVAIVELLQPDWLIVDHYALDIHWEQELRSYCKQLMVIDDLADRHHDCDMLLDQTYGRDSDVYRLLISEHCQLFCGAQYALLRPEFIEWRDYSLKRRVNGQLEHLLINLGGVDKDNITTQILRNLSNCLLPSSCYITVVMGGTAPWIKEVQQQAKKMPWTTEVLVGVNNMAELMANSDLAIGAAGSTSWERCCLGLPTVMICMAENQYLIAKDLHNLGAAISIQQKDINKDLSMILNHISTSQLKIMQHKALQVTEGSGAKLLVNYINSESN